MELRGLTIRQPWAQAVADGWKTTENRSQGFPRHYRGLVLVHAGMGWSARGEHDPRVLQVYLPESLPGFTRGSVLAVAEISDIHPASGCCAPWGEETYPPANPEDRAPGRVTHLTISNVVRLRRPVAVRGALGLWRPDEDLTLEVAFRLAEAVEWDLSGAQQLAERGDVHQLWHLLAEPAA